MVVSSVGQDKGKQVSSLLSIDNLIIFVKNVILMKRFSFLLLAMLIPISLYSIGNGKRAYMDASKTMSISISGDTLIVYPGLLPPSVCSLRKVSGNVYEISLISAPYFWSLLPNQYEISYKTPFRETNREVLSNASAPDDSIRIAFHLPYESSLIIEISSLPDDAGMKFMYNNENNGILFPRNRFGGGLHISFSPENIEPQDYTGRYYGLVKAYLDCVINQNCSEVHISIPELDAAFFARYQIHNELLIIRENSIYWRGTPFYRLH